MSAPCCGGRSQPRFKRSPISWAEDQRYSSCDAPRGFRAARACLAAAAANARSRRLTFMAISPSMMGGEVRRGRGCHIRCGGTAVRRAYFCTNRVRSQRHVEDARPAWSGIPSSWATGERVDLLRRMSQVRSRRSWTPPMPQIRPARDRRSSNRTPIRSPTLKCGEEGEA